MTPPTRAERELDWFFTAGASAMGLHAQGYDSTGAGVWDSERIGALHLARHDVGHRDDVDKYTRLEQRFRALDPEARAVLHARFVAYPWDNLVFMRSAAGVYAGVTPLTLAARKAYWRRYDGREVYPATLRAWLDLEAKALDRGASKLFRPMVVEARRMVAVALEGWGT